MDALDRSAMRIVRDSLDYDADQRDSLLTRRCGEKSPLRARVDELLKHAIEVLEHDENANRSEFSANDEPGDALPGTRLGAFRIGAQIGRGGMGVVYRGERIDADIAQTVAIKLIRRGFDFDDVHARFLRERRILAGLSHPGIARFIDGGVASGGRPWFALEFVHGMPIPQWCDRQRLDVRSRVRVFLDVCHAVQHAHTQLVVHRDLKPANILVNEDGAVCLLDFGVAGLLAGDGNTGTVPMTIGNRPALTPEYAAPEQFSGTTVGVATDVYALGVVLYELITGVLPHAVDRRDLAAAERAVREDQPTSLAQAIVREETSASLNPEARLAARRTALRGYRAQVRGDLARIVDKALAKEPQRRYVTVQVFADDLGRWLAGVPVQVSGNGRVYRLGKFVRRNRAAVAAAVLAGVAITTGVAGMLWTTRAAMIEAQRADAVFRVRTFSQRLAVGHRRQRTGARRSARRRCAPRQRARCDGAADAFRHAAHDRPHPARTAPLQRRDSVAETGDRSWRSAVWRRRRTSAAAVARSAACRDALARDQQRSTARRDREPR
ncbi:MAG: serine/threonine-protein kinase, partial [Dokdonella sp.]